LSLFLRTGGRPYGAAMADTVRYEVTLADTTVEVVGADAYAPDGALTTFYRCRDGREAIDVWATRVASFRTTDILRVLRIEACAERRAIQVA
jgi:hypothetical protein